MRVIFVTVYSYLFVGVWISTWFCERVADSIREAQREEKSDV